MGRSPSINFISWKSFSTNIEVLCKLFLAAFKFEWKQERRKPEKRKETGEKGGQSKGKQRKQRKERVKEREVRGKSRQDAQRKEL